MSAGFTPGPWGVDEDDREGMSWNRHICAGYQDRICFMSNTGDDPRGEANANLIAAAPDLYEAVSEAILRCSMSNSMRKQLHAALSLARGEAITPTTELGASSRCHASHGAEKSSPPIGFDRGER